MSTLKNVFPQRPAYDALSRLSVRDQSVPWECVLCMCVILVCHLGIVDEMIINKVGEHQFSY